MTTTKFSHNDLVGLNWPQTEGHIESVRGILVSTGYFIEGPTETQVAKHHYTLKWIWEQDKMHDRMLADSGYSKLWARYRNQKGFLPRVEFEPGVSISVALELLLKTRVRSDDLLNIEAAGGASWMSISDYFRSPGG
ncbi:hypothetical protein LCGC14_1592020 [marine sediment metagenome]|uniref:Uncharacterized protein n=1 Tax=marine sediment metagenome TaxID=412755 RepID=A0A0F9J005_9ZZZZ